MSVSQSDANPSIFIALVILISHTSGIFKAPPRTADFAAFSVECNSARRGNGISRPTMLFADFSKRFFSRRHAIEKKNTFLEKIIREKQRSVLVAPFGAGLQGEYAHVSPDVASLRAHTRSQRSSANKGTMSLYPCLLSL